MVQRSDLCHQNAEGRADPEDLAGRNAGHFVGHPDAVGGENGGRLHLWEGVVAVVAEGDWTYY